MAKGRSDRVLAAVVLSSAGPGAERYPMFELGDVSGEGAFLVGPLLLERGEDLTVELSFHDGSSLKVPAQVEGAQLGDRPGIRVSWSRDVDRKAIGKKLA